MNKAMILTVIALLVLAAACGGKQMTAKPLTSKSPTGEVTGHQQYSQTKPTPTPAPAPTKTAADALKEFKTQLQQPVSTVKSGTSPFFAPATTVAKSKADARKLLLERTRAAFKSGKGVAVPTDALTTFGPRYHTSSGSPTNLPKEYTSGD